MGTKVSTPIRNKIYAEPSQSTLAFEASKMIEIQTEPDCALLLQKERVFWA
jgi:hypothetical protein